MTLTVETGAGNPAADSFCSLAFADAYHAGLGSTAWAAVTDPLQREILLRRAAVFMEQAYRLRWAGYRVNAVQALSWPRYEVPMADAPGGYGALPAYYDYLSVPVAVQQAQCELALRSITISLAPDLKPLATRKTVGPITVEYQAGSRQTTRYSAVDGLLAPLMAASAGTVRLVRS